MVSDFAAGPLDIAAAEVETYVGASGWDQRPTLFALVRAADFLRDDPETATRLGLSDAPGEAFTPIEQEELPEGALDEVLAHIGWPDSVAGCAIAHEILILPPSAQDGVDGGPDSAAAAAAHPERREARLVVAVLRDGTSAAVLRLRPEGGADDDSEELLSGPDLAPNLSVALLTTLQD
jgi:hypothetical protein